MLHRSAAAAAIWLGGAVLASGVQAQSLEDALVQTYLTNPRLETARADLRATDELVPQALSGWRPSASVSAAIDRARVDSDITERETLVTRGVQLDIEQPLYRGGETVASTLRAEALVRVDRANLTSTEQTVLLDAVTAYTDLISARAVYELAVNNESRLRRQLEAAQDRFDVGEVTRTDVAQAEASLADAISDRTSADGDVSRAEATYRQIIGRPPGGLMTPQPLGDLPAAEDEAQSLAQARHPDILAAEYNVDAAANDVDVALSALKPRVSLNSTLDYTENPSTSINRQDSASIGASVTVPLYQGGSEYARVRETKQIVGSARSQLDDARRLIREEVADAWQALRTADSVVRSLSESVRANEIALDGTQQEALVGARTVLDVLDAENALFTAQVDLVRALRDRIIASYRLKAAVGELTAPELRLPVEYYDPGNYYDRTRNRWFGLGQPVKN